MGNDYDRGLTSQAETSAGKKPPAKHIARHLHFLDEDLLGTDAGLLVLGPMG